MNTPRATWTSNWEGVPVAEVSDQLAAVWLDFFCAPKEDNLAVTIEELSPHTLAVEVAAHEHQRTELGHYVSHAFLTAYSAEPGETTGMPVGSSWPRSSPLRRREVR